MLRQFSSNCDVLGIAVFSVVSLLEDPALRLLKAFLNFFDQFSRDLHLVLILDFLP